MLVTPDTINVTRYPNAISQLCSDFNLTCIDTTSFFKNTEEKPLFFEYDGHLDRKGYKVLADSIFYNLIKFNGDDLNAK